jgi:hypothetical protein
MFESLEGRQCMSATLLTVETVEPAPVAETTTAPLSLSSESTSGGCIQYPPILSKPIFNPWLGR